MTNYPAKIDTTVSLPTVVDNSTPISGVTVNRLRDAILAIEDELGIKPSGIYGTTRARLDTIELGLGNLQIIELAGDLGNTLANPYVIGIWGRPISNVAPQLDNVLTWDGIAWVPSPAPSGGSSGFAGGDLSGTYPSPSVVKIQGNSIANTVLGSTQDGYLLTWINASSQWQAKPPPVSFTAGGDLTGTATNQTVIGLRGKSLDPSLATIGSVQDGYALIWVNATSSWKAQSVVDIDVLAGDVTGPLTTSTVVALRGKTLSSSLSTIGATQDGYQLTWVNSNSDWEALPPNSTATQYFVAFNPFTTANTTFTNAAVFDFNLAALPSGANRKVILKIVAETTSPNMTVQLYNFTTATVIYTFPTITSTSATEFISGDLTSNFTNGNAIYQVQIKMAAGAPGDQITLDYAKLEVTYT